MLKYLLAVFFFVLSASLYAQTDSLFVYPRGNNFVIIYKVQNGETVFTLSRRFHVPPAVLADANGITYQSGIANNSLIIVPLAVYNYQKEQPANMNESRALYYRVRDEDDLHKVSKYADVSQHQIQEWNQLRSNTVRGGQTLLVGWVLFDATGMMPVKKNTAPPTATNNVTTPTPQVQKNNLNQNTVQQVIKNKDGSTTIILVPAEVSKPIDSLYITSPFGKLYLQQTDSGTKVDSDKGPAVFFDTKMNLSTNTFYAFHNTIPRGTVIKVYVPNAQKSILVKVIGTIPDTKQYYNCSIAINKLAKEMLGIHEDKTWCEFWFAPIPAPKTAR